MKRTETGMPILNREELQQFINRWHKSKKTKGILLMGKPGVGKSTFMLRNLVGNYEGDTISCDTLVMRYMLKGMESFMDRHGRLNITQKVIDDLGTEQIATHYGNTLNLMQLLIQQWYDLGHPKHFTTNLNITELTERYGPRVIDRLKEMCYFIVLDDTNFRDTLGEDEHAIVEREIREAKEESDRLYKEQEEKKRLWKEREEEEKRNWDEKQKEITELELTMANPGQQDG
jgi:DNA replication protein DnaC